jgi:hypothetical protein
MQRMNPHDIALVELLLDSHAPHFVAACIERSAQDKEHGGPAHDDQHAPNDWLHFIEKQTQAALDCYDFDAEALDIDGYRQRLTKIVALGLAALGSLDRHEVRQAQAAMAGPACECGGCQLFRVLKGMQAGGDITVVEVDSVSGLRDVLSTLARPPGKPPR